MPKLVYCVGDAIKADCNSFPYPRKRESIPEREVINSFPATANIRAFERLDDAKNYAASLNKYDSDFQQLTETHAVFAVKVDAAVLQEEKEMKVHLWHPVLTTATKDCSVKYYDMPSSNILDRVSVEHWGKEYKLQTEIKQRYEKAWDETKGAPSAKVSHMVDVYKGHRGTVFGHRLRSTHEPQADAIMTAISASGFTQYDLYNLVMRNLSKLQAADQKHDYAAFLNVIRENLSNDGETYRGALVKHLSPMAVDLVNTIFSYAVAPLMKAEVLNANGEVEEVLTSTAPVTSLSHR